MAMRYIVEVYSLPFRACVVIQNVPDLYLIWQRLLLDYPVPPGLEEESMS